MVKRKPFTAQKKSKGKTYQYFRKDGKYVRLPDDPNSEEYDKAYWALMRGGGPVSKVHTFDKLIASYKQSPKWDNLASRTKRDYSKVLEYIVDTIGSKNPTKMRRSTIIEAQLANKHRARFANYIVHMLSILFEHAIDLDWQRHNPARGIARIKTGEGHKPWPETAIKVYRSKATGYVLLAFELALGTGQRISDVLKMEWGDIEDGGINVAQNKTGAQLWIPFTKRLADIIENTPRKSLTYIISDDYGRPIKYDQLQKASLKLKKELGLEAYTSHGLRYSAASELAEAGCTDQQIAAITGHRSLPMVRKYSQGANQRRLAIEAMAKRERK